MLFTVLCTLIAVHVLSEVPPAPPQKVYVDNWLLAWTPATEEGEEGEVSYTVEYSSFDSDVWTDVPACVHISLNSCNVTSTKAEDELGCVMLRVQAERRGLTSTPVKACSRHGDSCTPDFSLTAGKNSLTVHLNRTHSLALQYGDSAKYRVYYGKKGERLQKYKEDVASVTIHGLQEGQLYCTEVQYVYYDVPVGLASCTQCEVISTPREDSKQSKIIAAVVLVVVVLLVLMSVLAYFIIFHHGTIKRMLHLPYHIPEDFFLEPFPKNHRPIHSHTEEHYHVISSISPEELRE